MTGTTSSSKVTEDQIFEISGGEKFQVKATRQGSRGKPRKYYRVNGSNGPDWDIPNNDIESVKHAILERVFFVKDGKGGFKRCPKPWEHESVVNDDKPYSAARSKIRNRLHKFREGLEQVAINVGKVNPISDEEFLAFYGGAKRRCYEAAVESLKDRPLEERDCWVKVFTKDEYRKPGGAPRAIQPRSPRFNVKLGRYLKHIEHEIFCAIDKVFDPTDEHRTVAKGMNMVERGNVIANMWNSFDNPVAVGLDASRFDQHINRLLLEFEHGVYHSFVNGEGEDLPKLATLLRQQLCNKGSYHGKDGKISYKVSGCRMSGDMNTSLGNVIIMCALMYSYFDHKGMSDKVKLLNDGDDCVIIMDERNLTQFRDGLQDWFLEMGLSMEYDGIYTELERVEFCQSRPVWSDDHGYRLVPRPTKRLYSDLISTKDLSTRKVYEKQVGAIAGCGLALSGGLPLYQSFYQWLGRGATPWIPSQGDYYYKFRQELVDKMQTKQREPSLAERISFYLAFDVTPEEQVFLEEYYDQLPDPVYSQPVDEPFRVIDSIQHLCPPEQKMRKIQ